MKKLLAIIMLLITLPIFGQTENAFKYFDEKSGKECLIGECDRTAFYDTLFISWFDEEYDNYVIDTETLEDIKRDVNKLDITIVMATWCSDSRREVPRFFKIMDYLSYPSEKIKIIAVNREKKGIENETDNLNIKFVPTFIFYKDGHEIGRIIETPNESLEKDLNNIINLTEN